MVYSAVRFGITPAINALATIMLAITIAVIAVTGVFLRRQSQRMGTTAEDETDHSVSRMVSVS